MKYLIDTQCWLWLQAAPERFPTSLIHRLADPDHQLFLSSASAWEIATKHALGKLPLPRPPGQYVPSRMRKTGTTPLPIEMAHALRVATLPVIHRDPFDRVLVAQAQIERMTLVSSDPVFERYHVRWIRV